MLAIQTQVGGLDQPFEEARGQYDHVVAELRSRKVQGMTHSEVESLLQKEGTELLRRLYQGYLDALGDGAASTDVRNDQCVILNHTVHKERLIETVFGTVQLERRGYRQREVSTLYPLDARLNLPTHLYSYGVERRVVGESIKNSFDEAVATLEATTGAQVP